MCCRSARKLGQKHKAYPAVQSRYRWQYLRTHRARRKDTLFMPSHVEADRPIADKTRWKSPRIFFQHLCPNSASPAPARSFLYARERTREKSDAKSDKPACKLRNGKSWFDIDSSARYDYKAILTSFWLTVAMRCAADRWSTLNEIKSCTNVTLIYGRQETENFQREDFRQYIRKSWLYLYLYDDVYSLRVILAK